jgi:hypothetical protein
MRRERIRSECTDRSVCVCPAWLRRQECWRIVDLVSKGAGNYGREKGEKRQDPRESWFADLSGEQAIADASEALAGAVGRLKDHELIQRVCTKLQIDRLSSDTSWKDLAEMPALDFGSINATLQEVDAIYALTGHSFADRSMLDMILVRTERNSNRGRTKLLGVFAAQ